MGYAEWGTRLCCVVPRWPPTRRSASIRHRMSREATHSATTYPSSAALSGFAFAYRYAWRFS